MPNYNKHIASVYEGYSLDALRNAVAKKGVGVEL